MQNMIEQILDKEKLNKLQNILFDIMLTIEIIVVFLDKSDYHFTYESYVFRITFLISCLIIFIGIKNYNIKEWLISIPLLIIAVADYKISGRNDILRFFIFMMACKGLDLKRKLRLFFYENLIGSAILIFLSVTGIFGKLMSPHADGTMLYVFGFGNANAFHCMFMMILFLGVYIYSEKLKWYYYLALFVGNAILYKLTSCDTAFALVALGLISSFILYGIKINARKLGDYTWPYIVGIVSFLFSIGFSIWAAIVSKYTWMPWFEKVQFIDNLLTGRIKNLYWNWDAHPGAVESWKLFAGRDTGYYFDMGWCRLVYWYGIIPALCVIVLLLILYIDCMNKRDGYLLVILTCLSIYTIVEAHLVSVYIGRNYILLFLGVCIFSLFDKRDGEKVR